MSSTVVVSLEENRLRFREHSIRLTSRLTDLAYALARRMPETVSHATITQQMWGADEPDYADTNIKVSVTQLRNKIRPIGLDVENTWGRGYRLTILPEMSQTERRETAHASA
jgi:DNA-binding response OmpR family regulator